MKVRQAILHINNIKNYKPPLHPVDMPDRLLKNLGTTFTDPEVWATIRPEELMRVDRKLSKKAAKEQAEAEEMAEWDTTFTVETRAPRAEGQTPTPIKLAKDKGFQHTVSKQPSAGGYSPT